MVNKSVHGSGESAEYGQLLRTRPGGGESLHRAGFLGRGILVIAIPTALCIGCENDEGSGPSRNGRDIPEDTDKGSTPRDEGWLGLPSGIGGDAGQQVADAGPSMNLPEAGTPDLPGAPTADPSDPSPPGLHLSETPQVDLSAGACDAETASSVWSFDDSAEGWTVSTDGAEVSLQWTEAGMLQLDMVPGDAGVWTVQVELNGDFGDMTGQEIASSVSIDQSNVTAAVFVQSLGGISDDFWANAERTTMPKNSWSCIELAVDSPDFLGEHFDPTRIMRIGVTFEGTGPARALVDMFRF